MLRQIAQALGLISPPQSARPAAIDFLPAGPLPLTQRRDHLSPTEALSHPVVFRAINTIVDTVASIEWLPMAKPGAQPPAILVDHLAHILKHPNPDMSGSKLREWLVLNYVLYQRACIKVTTADVGGGQYVPLAIHALQTDLVTVELDRYQAPVRYNYGFGPGAQSWPSYQAWSANRAGDSFVYEIWKPPLSGQRWPISPNMQLAAVTLPAQFITAVLKRALEAAEGHPNFRCLISTEAALTEQQITILADQINALRKPGGEKAGSIPVLQGMPGLTVHDMGQSLADVHNKASIDDMTRMIFNTFRVPLALAGLGASDAARYAQNLGESRAMFWNDVLLPSYVRPILKDLTEALGQGMMEIAPDLNSVAALIEGRAYSMAALGPVSFLTINEKRAMFGMPPIPGGDVRDGQQSPGAKPEADLS